MKNEIFVILHKFQQILENITVFTDLRKKKVDKSELSCMLNSNIGT